MKLLKDIAVLLTGLYLGLMPFLGYYFTHGPACPCHALIKTIPIPEPTPEKTE